jgi:hypothetical protein
MFDTGIARHSMHHMDPVLHLLVRDGSEWATWCGGGRAQVENTVTQRRCRRCLALARADLIENGVAPSDRSDLDWYLRRTPDVA